MILSNVMLIITYWRNHVNANRCCIRWF